MAHRIIPFALLLCMVLTSKNLFSQQTIIFDHDNDGIEDNLDSDDDNDGILDIVEMNVIRMDMDGDGLPNYWDLDSDNDGISDATEVGFADTNGDGTIDDFSDTNKDGQHDLLETQYLFADTDLDNIPNWLDTDSNNDGIVDAVEMGGLDENHDGRLDGFRDSDFDGLHDKVDGDVGNILAPGDVFFTSSSKDAFVPTSGQLCKYTNLTRLARVCADIDFDGLCDDFDGDVGNTLMTGYDFPVEEL